MEATMQADAGTAKDVAAQGGRSVSGAQLPLAMVGEGDTVSVLKVRGDADLRQHLFELGFVPGAQVQVVSRVNGDVLVKVKGATFGIGRDMAMKIVTA